MVVLEELKGSDDDAVDPTLKCYSVKLPDDDHSYGMLFVSDTDKWFLYDSEHFVEYISLDCSLAEAKQTLYTILQVHKEAT